MEQKKVTLYMAGNSHIDPVWFWDWEEGMQEVKATFASALDRMDEDPEMTFTATSSAFFEWLERTSSELFARIRRRVEEGRFRIAGGWFIEPDCILPSGEAFVRQGLYAQRYFLKTFGKLCRTGSNVDSFGHTISLPQILKKSGMDEYVFMRPRLDMPAFFWEGPDGSRVTAVSLPSEYTTWFYESTREAVELASAAAERAGLHAMICCFGVGNHGGGPTKKNLESVRRLRGEMPETGLPFGGYDEFFDGLTEKEKASLPVRHDFFNGINTGCYSMDGQLKWKNRCAERDLLTAEAMLVLERAFTGNAHAGSAQMRDLWKTLLFNQFHDTLGGTAASPARDEAVRQIDEVSARARKIRVLSVQNIVNHIDTQGEGFPLFLFNPSGEPYSGEMELEINWFCKDGLVLLDESGQEIPYQRSYTDAKVRNYNLGGRRRIVFHADIPAYGFVMYRTAVGEPALACDIRRAPEFPLAVNNGFIPDDDPHVMENDRLLVRFTEDGALCSLIDKRTGYDALSAPVRYAVWTDERDAWGHCQDRRYEDSGESLIPELLETIESGSIRKVVRAVYRLGGSRLEQRFILSAGSDALEVRSRLLWDGEWKMLRASLPLRGVKRVAAECAYGTFFHEPENGEEYSMHRFADAFDESGRGLLTINDGKYAYILQEGALDLPLARSAIFAQGNGVGWYNPVEGYEYADQGVHSFTLWLHPHGEGLSQEERFRMAASADHRPFALADCRHDGKAGKVPSFSAAAVKGGHFSLAAVKPGEEGGAVYRVQEIAGREGSGVLCTPEGEIAFTAGAWELLTFRWTENGWQKTNLLEFPEESEKA